MSSQILRAILNNGQTSRQSGRAGREWLLQRVATSLTPQDVVSPGSPASQEFPAAGDFGSDNKRQDTEALPGRVAEKGGGRRQVVPKTEESDTIDRAEGHEREGARGREGETPPRLAPRVQTALQNLEHFPRI